ncbi:MAG: XylR family transcriptional regulator [Aureliella sp.]
MQRDKRNVALIIETSIVYGRDLLEGIVRFMRMRGNWSVFLEQRDLSRQPPSWLNEWNGDGIISRVTTPKLTEAVERTGVPLVELTDRRGKSVLPQIRANDHRIGELAAEHLIERGFRRFGYCGFRGEAWSKRREEAFLKAANPASQESCTVYESRWFGPGTRSWDEEQASIRAWLASIQPPFAVMACNDVRGKHVIDACESLGLAVPEQVAVIGVDNDDQLCRICSTPLSSVLPNAALVGFRAAELLETLMSGGTPKQQIQTVDPLGVQTRQSTDVVAIEDRDIASALHYIRRNACNGITVDEVVRANVVSRSTLERQMRKYLGRSPQEEIRHVQIKRARELLVTTDLPIEKIAHLCGFDHPEYMHVVFKRITGITAGAFRRQANP